MLNLSLLSSFRYPAFRLLWGSMFLTFLSTNVRNVLVSWLVLESTDSALLLGLTMALNFAPLALGVISGVIADRMDKRKLMIVVNIVQITTSIVMGLLVMGGNIQFWYIALIILTGSTVASFRLPAIAAYTVELVGVDNITNATSLNSISMFIAGTVGPSLVGFLVDLIGISTFFYLNAAFLGLGVVLIIMIRDSKNTHIKANTSVQKPVLKDLVEGFRFSWQNKPVLGSQMVFLITNLFMWPCVWTLIPVFARDVLTLDAAGFGWLTATNRLGGFIANLGLASREPRRKGRLLFTASFIWGILWLLFSMVTWLPFSLVSLLIIGILGPITMTLASVIMLINTGPEIRGRVLGIRSLAISSQSPGSLIAGALAESYGAGLAINVEAILFLLAMVGLMKIVPELSKQT